jgi:hypothetical protein
MAPSGMLPCVTPPPCAGMLLMTQWMNPSASTSRTTMATSAVPVGTLVSASAGEMSSPKHVYTVGMAPPSVKSGLVICM